MTGRKSVTPVRFTMYNGLYMKTSEKMVTTTDRVEWYYDKLEQSL